jgi:hypothetical protein
MRLLLLGTVVSSNLPGLQLLDIINHAPKAWLCFEQNFKFLSSSSIQLLTLILFA